MIDEETGEPVDTEDKGRGYELSKGRYVPIDEEELKAVQVESTHTVDIQGFVRPRRDRQALSRQAVLRRACRQDGRRSLRGHS